MRRCDFDQTFELQSQSRTVSIENQAKNVQNPFLPNNIGDGTLLPQAIPGGTGTRPKAGGAREFNGTMRVLNNVLHNTLAQGSSVCTSASPHLHGHPRCAVVRSLTLCSSPCSFPCVSLIPSSSTWTLTCTSPSMWPTSGQLTTGTPPTEESGPLAENTPLTKDGMASEFHVREDDSW